MEGKVQATAWNETMSNKKDDGGPAFPSIDAEGFVSTGMSLRDWFAGQILSSAIESTAIWIKGDSQLSCVKKIYDLADAMLEARQRG